MEYYANKFENIMNSWEKKIEEEGFTQKSLQKYYQECREIEKLIEKKEFIIPRPEIWIGFTTTNRPSGVNELLKSIFEEQKIFGYKGEIQIFILENSTTSESINKNLQIIKKFKQNGMKIKYWDIEKQIDFLKKDLELQKILKIDNFEESCSGKGIAQNRTFLRYLIGKECQQKITPKNPFSQDTPIIWVIDDDLQFANLVLRHDGYLVKAKVCNYFAHIVNYRILRKDLGIMIGGYTNFPPVPKESYIFYQLIDLYDLLKNTLKQTSSKTSYNLPVLNSKTRIEYLKKFDIPDYYYSLSRKSKTKTEMIFPFIPYADSTTEEIIISKERTLNDIIDEYISLIPSIIQGTPITRPLLLKDIYKKNIYSHNPLESGGNTIYLWPHFLVALPNFITRIFTINTRRSDMIWAFFMKDLFKKSVVGNPFSLFHGRIPIDYSHIKLSDIISSDPLKNKKNFINKLLQEFYGVIFLDSCKKLFKENQLSITNPLAKIGPSHQKSKNIKKDEILKEVILKNIDERTKKYQKQMEDIRNIIDKIEKLKLKLDSKYQKKITNLINGIKNEFLLDKDEYLKELELFLQNNDQNFKEIKKWIITMEEDSQIWQKIFDPWLKTFMNKFKQGTSYKKIIGVIGGTRVSTNIAQFAEFLGMQLVNHGYRIATGGLGGVMEYVSKGAHASLNYKSGVIIGVLPKLRKEDANPYCDIIFPTGMNFARNVLLISLSDIIIALGGGAGTLSEIALAWQMKKPIICVNFNLKKDEIKKTKNDIREHHSDLEYFQKHEGWSTILGGIRLDAREERPIYTATSIEEVLNNISEIEKNLAEKKKMDCQKKKNNFEFFTPNFKN